MVCKRLMQHNQRINPLWCANLRYFSESTQRRNMATPPSCFTQELLCMQIDFLSDFMDKSYLCRKCRLPLNRHTQTTKGPCIYLDFFTESASGFLLVDEKCVYCSQPVYKHPQGPAPQRAPAAAATAQHGQARATLLAKTEQQVMEPSTAQDVDSSACALPAHTHTLCPGPSEGQQAAEAGDTASSVPTVKFLRDCARLCKKDNLNNVSAAIVLWDNSGIHRLFSIGAESMAFLADKQVHDAVFRAVGSRASDDLVLGLPALPELFVGVDKLRQCAKAVILATQRMRRHAFLQEQKAASEQAESRRPKSKADFFNHVHSPLENHIPPRFHAALSRVLTKAQLRGVVGSWSAIACKRAILAVYAELGLPTPSNAYWAPGARAAASISAVAPHPSDHPNPTPPSVTGTPTPTAPAAPAPPIALQNVPLESEGRALPLAPPEQRKGAANTARGVEASLVAGANASDNKRTLQQLEAHRSKRARSRQTADGSTTGSATPDLPAQRGTTTTNSAKQPVSQTRTRSGGPVKAQKLF
eukprot:m.331064 g.331064  ORF g.331064 m.331064 type:complete len:530 (-) comp19770_c1_seq2:78-1667(-)